MDFDLSGMDEQTARSYVVSMITHLKQTEAEIADLERDLALWNARIATAEANQRADLAAQARAQVEALTAKRIDREAEVSTFRTGVESMKRQLKILPAIQRSIDPDLLLQGLEEISGKTDTVSRELNRHAAEDALAELKRRLSEGS